jgi:hypothetical protein
MQSMTDRPKDLLKAELDLIRLHAGRAGPDWDDPFLAGCGTDYMGSNPRILIVGKATGGWRDVADTTDAERIRQHSDDFLAWVADAPFSAFWRHIDRLARDIAESAGQSWQRPLNHIAWTNLARIGMAGGNPQGRAFAVQEDICCRLLTGEINWLKPDLMVLLTHNYQHRFVSSFFRTAEWRTLRNAGHDDAWVGIVDGRMVFWTAHPQGKARERLVQESRAVAGAFRAWRTCSSEQR